MAARKEEEITHLLRAWQAGDEQAFEKLLPLIYDRLHLMAHHQLKKELHAGLQTTELLNEAVAELLEAVALDWQSRQHFYRTAAMAMHRLLIDLARKRKAPIHGGQLKRVDLEEHRDCNQVDPETLLTIDAALTDIQAQDPQLVLVVKLRFFAGYTIKETAEALELPVIQVNRKWAFAKAWLKDILDRRGSAH